MFSIPYLKLLSSIKQFLACCSAFYFHGERNNSCKLITYIIMYKNSKAAIKHALLRRVQINDALTSASWHVPRCESQYSCPTPWKARNVPSLLHPNLVLKHRMLNSVAKHNSPNTGHKDEVMTELFKSKSFKGVYKTDLELGLHMEIQP